MADFKTHIAASTFAGIGYGAAGYVYGAPISACLVAGGLCSVSGMLPDLDSGSGRPVREMMAFIAAVVPALMIPRFLQMGLEPEAMALAAAVLYLAIRFGVGEIFKRYTVHRGMWHSIPAMAVAALLALLVVSGDRIEIRLFKSGAVALGFFTHLVLDELWSLRIQRGRLRIKRSFGTALKLWSRKSLWANVSTYGKLIVLVALVIGDPYIMQHLGFQEHTHGSEPWLKDVVGRGSGLFSGDRSPDASRHPDALGTALDALTNSIPAKDQDEASRQTRANEPVGTSPSAPATRSARRLFYYPTTESPVRR